jgi:hypothetical protein
LHSFEEVQISFRRSATYNVVFKEEVQGVQEIGLTRARAADRKQQWTGKHGKNKLNLCVILNATGSAYRKARMGVEAPSIPQASTWQGPTQLLL